MSEIKNTVKKMLRKCLLILPAGDRIVAKIVGLKRKIESKAHNIEIKQQTSSTEPVDPSEIFTAYYQNNFWDNEESVSGIGSTLEQTQNIRREIPKLLDFYKVEKLLDAPCGDFNWFQYIKRSNGLEYIGGDIVKELIEQNQIKYGNHNTKFIYIDIIKEQLPPVDMWLCRDCLLHFSYADIFKTLLNFLSSDIKYILTSVHINCLLNTDIPTGQARLINLELPPFNFSKPILYIDDWLQGSPKEKKLGLWTKSMIANSLKSNPEMPKFHPKR